MRELKDVIGKLGEMSPDDIALHFEEHHILAVPRKDMQCAVAEYVQQETDLKYITVDIEYTCGLSGAWEIPSEDSKVERVKNPSSVREFIMLFDGEVYPNLIRNPKI